MSLVHDIINQFQLQLFDTVTKNRLVYNSCWEDPRVDRQLLNIDNDSSIVMLTSAGCNALDYLLDEPATIHCVDSNPAQNALLELKQSLFSNGNYTALWNLFGTGRSYGADSLYQRNLRPLLSSRARNFWDHHIDYFFPSAAAPSFYFRGTAGTVVYIIYNQLQYKGLSKSIENMLEALSTDEQAYYFREIEPHIWNPFSRWLLQQNATLSLLGVPPCQRALIDEETDGGLLSFIHQALCDVFTRRPLADNYFWRVYLTGSYTKQCCPNYLKEEYFGTIRTNINRIRQTNGTLVNFLKRNPGRYSHFVLLDHLDWLGHHQPDEMAREWKLILKNASPGAKILFRSAGTSRTILPRFVNRHVQFNDEATDRLHPCDRVGTYGSTHLGIVSEPL